MRRLSSGRRPRARRFRTSGSGAAGELAARLRALFAALLLAACCSLAPPAAAQAGRQVESWFERLHRSTVVEADGSFVETIDDLIAVEPLDDLLPEVVQRVLHWNASAGSIEIVEAATVKPDGRRVPAPPEMMFEDRQTSDGGLFQDQRFVVVSFVEFEPGDRVHLKARHRRTVPFYPGHFFEVRGAPPQPVREMLLRYDLPETMPLHHDAAGFELEALEREAGRLRYRWRYVGDIPPVAEHRVVAPTDYADRLFVSTMPDNRALARAYLHDAYPMADPTARIRALAAQLTRDARGTRDKARLLYDWMRANVAYGGEYLGRGSVVPRPAERTLDEREGDCKDHATLYEALLAAAGIDSSPVLVNASNAYELPAVPTLGVFNHVMTWIPALGLFVDSSAIGVDFGELPTVLSDKPALIVKTGEIARTPPQRPIRQSIELRGRVAADGSARVAIEETSRGWFATTRRRMLEAADADALERAARTMLHASRLDGSATLGGVRGEADAVRLRLAGEATGVTIDADAPTPRLRALSSIGVGIEGALADFAASRVHTAPSVCVPAHVDEQARWTLAPGLRAVAPPSARSIDGDGFRYRSEYRIGGREIEVRRSLRLDFASNVCTPERVRIVQRLASRVFDDLGATVALERVPPAGARR